MNNHRLVPFIMFFLMAIASGQAAALPLQNGDFFEGLTGWAIQGNVTADNREAVLGDDSAIYSLLSQAVSSAAGDYTIAFDFKNQLSSFVSNTDENFNFPDVLFSTLYFINDLDQFNLDSGGFDDAVSLLSLDYTGVYDDSGVIGVSVKGDDWQHFFLSFHSDYAFVLPVFELLDFNFVDHDSSVRIDNVVIQANPQTPPINAVPEPATLVLMGCGFLGLLILKFKPTSV